MAARGWSHNVPGDPVHFEHLSSPDIRGKDVLAFQRLWNRNKPNDKISEDGAYGPQTEARLKSAPATGFAAGPTCGNRLVGADVVMVEGPDRLAPGAKARYTITFDNTTDVDWPASTRLHVVGDASQLYDAATWTSPSEVGTLGSDIGAGAQGVIEIDVQAPSVTTETPVFTQVELLDGGSAPLGVINIALTVTPDGNHEDSADAHDAHDDAAETTGGCSAGGGAGWAALLVPALIVLRRRRR
jgi:Synergist-CTERM protein sorting domain-containing protein